MSWMREFDELLIQSIQKYPYIYNVTLKEFKNENIKADAWQAVALEVGMNEGACQRRWRTLRDGYTRYRKSLISRSCSGNKCRESIYESMSFLDQFVKHRGITANLDVTAQEFPDEVDELALSDDCSTSTPLDTEPQPHPKRIRVSEGKVSDNQLLNVILARPDILRSDDEFESFGRSVAATLRRLKPLLQAAAKVKIQQLLFDLEFGETDSNTASLDLHCS